MKKWRLKMSVIDMKFETLMLNIMGEAMEKEPYEIKLKFLTDTVTGLCNGKVIEAVDFYAKIFSSMTVRESEKFKLQALKNAYDKLADESEKKLAALMEVETKRT